MSDKFTQLQAVVTPEELRELTIRRAAVDRLRDMYEKTPLDKVGKEWRAAKNELEVEIDKLWQQYNKEAPAFKDVTSAWEWLKAQGYDVGRSTVYKAVKDGQLRKEADGRVLEIAVRAYAAGLRKKDSAADPGLENGKKLRLEIETMELKLERQQFEFERERGRYILREDLTLEIIGRVQVFEAQFDHFCMTKAPELVQLCGGDTATVPQVQAFMRSEKDRLITAMADVDRFQVIMVADEAGDRNQGSGVGDQEGEE